MKATLEQIKTAVNTEIQYRERCAKYIDSDDPNIYFLKSSLITFLDGFVQGHSCKDSNIHDCLVHVPSQFKTCVKKNNEYKLYLELKEKYEE